MLRLLARCALTLALLLFTACSATPQGPTGPFDDGRDYFPGDTWRTAVPAALRFDSAAFARVLRDAQSGRYGTLHGIVVVRNGYVIAEHYYNWSGDSPHTMQSVTKSVTSLLFGMVQQRYPQDVALQSRLLESLDRYEGSVANVDARKREITLRDMLTMRTGMDFHEQPYPGSPLDELNRSRGDWVKLVLDRPMTSQPGSTWQYNSGSPIVMCGLMREVTGEPVDVFAERELFAPLGVRGASWFLSPYDRLPHCGGGLNLRAQDLARIGYLVLRGGRWGSAQIVPSAWITESTAPVTTGSPLFFGNYNSSYGYYWWGFPRRRGGSDHGVIAASGSGGQWLFVDRYADVVVAIIAENGAGLDLYYDIAATIR